MRHDATSPTAAKPRKMRRLGLEPTRRRWICAAQCPQSFRNKKKHAPSPKRVRRDALDLNAREAGQVAQQQLRELKGFATQGYNNEEVRNIQAMMQI